MEDDKTYVSGLIGLSIGRLTRMKSFLSHGVSLENDLAPLDCRLGTYMEEKLRVGSHAAWKSRFQTDISDEN